MTILVTGSSGGVGSAVLRKLKSEGVSCLGLDLVDSSSHPTVKANLADLSELEKVSLPSDFGAITGIVHSAAHQPLGKIWELSSEDWLSSFTVNVLSLQTLTSRFRQDLIDSRGTVVAISSVHAKATSTGMSAYAASKSALESWIRSSAIEYGSSVSFVGISLGAVDTPKLREGLQRWPEDERRERLERLVARTPAGYVASAEEIASRIFSILQDGNASYFTGNCLPLDGGVSARLASE